MSNKKTPIEVKKSELYGNAYWIAENHIITAPLYKDGSYNEEEAADVDTRAFAPEEEQPFFDEMLSLFGREVVNYHPINCFTHLSEIKWVVISPDGLPISFDKWNSREDAETGFNEWLKRFEGQGYYSSVKGRIALQDVQEACRFISAIELPCRLKSILDFDTCKTMVETAKEKNETLVILCPHYSINVQSKYEDGEELQFDLEELSDYIGNYVSVNDYDDLVVDLTTEE